jgi:hypothetical protein
LVFEEPVERLRDRVAIVPVLLGQKTSANESVHFRCAQLDAEPDKAASPALSVSSHASGSGRKRYCISTFCVGWGRGKRWGHE